MFASFAFESGRSIPKIPPDPPFPKGGSPPDPPFQRGENRTGRGMTAAPRVVRNESVVRQGAAGLKADRPQPMRSWPYWFQIGFLPPTYWVVYSGAPEPVPVPPNRPT
jgi:hypothetical protein